MKFKFEYRIEDGSLIIDNYFNNLKIGSINCGSVENILNKCKLYDEEYETLLKENEYMIHMAKDFEQLQQENKQLKDNWSKLKKYLHNVDVVIDYNENFDGHFINYDELIDKMKELEQGSDNK